MAVFSLGPCRSRARWPLRFGSRRSQPHVILARAEHLKQKAVGIVTRLLGHGRIDPLEAPRLGPAPPQHRVHIVGSFMGSLLTLLPEPFLFVYLSLLVFLLQLDCPHDDGLFYFKPVVEPCIDSFDLQREREAQSCEGDRGFGDGKRGGLPCHGFSQFLSMVVPLAVAFEVPRALPT